MGRTNASQKDARQKDARSCCQKDARSKMGKRAKNQKEGLRKPKSGNSKPPDGLQGVAMAKGKKGRAKQRAILAAELDKEGSGFKSAKSASQRKNAKKIMFAH